MNFVGNILKLFPTGSSYDVSSRDVSLYLGIDYLPKEKVLPLTLIFVAQFMKLKDQVQVDEVVVLGEEVTKRLATNIRAQQLAVEIRELFRKTNSFSIYFRVKDKIAGLHYVVNIYGEHEVHIDNEFPNINSLPNLPHIPNV